MNNPNATSPVNNGRHTEWFMASVFSIIALIALLKHYDGDLKEQEKVTKWAVSGMSVAFTFATLAVIANLIMREKFIGTVIEGGMAIMACGFWAAVLPTVMDPENDLAVETVTGGIQNANMYFFSWGGFIMSFLALASFAKEKRGGLTGTMSMSTVDVLAMTSFVTMIAAVRLWQANDCDTQDYYANFMEEACNRTSFAISLGVISAITCLVWTISMMYLSGPMVVYYELVLGLLVLSLWCFGVGYITFGGASAPASALGNLYFFTWGSFALSVVLFMKQFNVFMDRNKGTTVETEQRNPEVNVVDTEKEQDQYQGGGVAENVA